MFAIRDWLGAFRTLDSLLALEAKYTRLFDAQTKRLDEIIDRLNRLEAREQVIVAEAKGAAAAAASAVAASHLGELARLFGGLEERVRRLESKDSGKARLRPPEP
jgi:hypothetical protein